MRIKNKKVDINSNKIKNFFAGRTKKLKTNSLASVLYQDDHPELAVERDRTEKKIVQEIIGFDNDDSVLDIGCGIGRWADELSEKVGYYLGTDYTEGFINYAKNKKYAKNNVKFLCLSAQDTTKVNIKEDRCFTKIIIAGLFPYLNDRDAITVLKNMMELICHSGIIYFREPCGINMRLTLKNIWSEELKQEYSAIYRTSHELIELFDNAWGRGKYKILHKGRMYKDNKLNNRTETQQMIYIIRLNQK